MRTVKQPGIGPAERIQWVEARGTPVAGDLEAGLPLLEAVRRIFAAHGCASGVLRLEGGAFGPFAYVMPALSETPRYAAFYSAPWRPPGLSRVHAGALTLGLRDGAPFFHCHALWTEADGILRGGHVLPEETFVARPIRIGGIGLDGAAFATDPDPETGFTLFGPVPHPGAGSAAGRRVFALRLRPNQDLSASLEAFCRERDIAAAELHGGVGSIIGASYRDGRRVDAFATEMAIRSGRISAGDGGEPEAVLDVALVDYTGAVSEGRLVRGDNPVLMTVEAVLEAGG
jgi:predicted DNA-binding protein with PD1-like motif